MTSHTRRHVVWLLPFLLGGGMAIGSIVGYSLASGTVTREGPAGDVAGAVGALLAVVCLAVGVVLSGLTLAVAKLAGRGAPGGVLGRVGLSLVTGGAVGALALNQGTVAPVATWVVLLVAPVALTWGRGLRGGSSARASVAAVLGVLAVMAPAETAAQNRDPASTIASDRPGLGDGAWVLPSGIWQVEAGVALSDNGSFNQLSLGQGLVRVGAGALELRLYANSLALGIDAGGFDNGFEDLGFGVKLPLGDPLADTRWAVVGGASLPTGTGSASADTEQGFGTLIVEGSLSDRVGVAVNAGYSFAFGDAADGTLSLLVTPAWTIESVEGLSAFAGWAGFFGDGAEHILELGLAYLQNDDTQLDLNGGFDSGGDSWFFGFGVARRWR